MHQCREYGRRTGRGKRERRRYKRRKQEKEDVSTTSVERKERRVPLMARAAGNVLEEHEIKDVPSYLWNCDESGPRDRICSSLPPHVWSLAVGLPDWWGQKCACDGLSICCVVPSLLWPILKPSLDLTRSSFDSLAPHLTKSGPIFTDSTPRRQLDEITRQECLFSDNPAD